MFNGATNFYNLNNENFHDFLMEMYRKIDLLDKDTNYIRNHLIDELRKELRKIIANGELIVDIESVVDDFLSNGLDENKVVTDIKKKLEECSSQLDNNIRLGYEKTLFDNMKDRFESKYVNVKDFGVKGDGITDDTSAIKNAITYCEENQIDLFFPKGKSVDNYLKSDIKNINKTILNKPLRSLDGNTPKEAFINVFDENIFDKLF